MGLTLEKIKLCLKDISWRFIVPCLVASVICIVALFFVKSIIPAVITAAALLGILGLLTGLFLTSWLKFWRYVQLKVYNYYIIPNGMFGTNEKRFKSQIKTISDALCNHVYELCALYGAFISKADVQNTLENIVIVFVDDISEEDYNERWGTKWKHISGLCGGSYVLVEFLPRHTSLINTALEHELAHIVMMKLKNKLGSALHKTISEKLGVYH